jgi:PAS domain S-box-containing protein
MANDTKHVTDILSYVESACVRFELAWNITYVNPQCELLLGTTAEALIGTDLRETLPDVVSVFYKTLARTISTHAPQRTDAVYGPTGKHLELFANYYDDGVLAVFRDVTSVKQNQQSLHDAANHYQTILATIADALIHINQKGLITSFNMAAETIFGYKAKEVIGREVSILLPENERPAHAGYIAQSDIYEPRIIRRSRDLEGRRKDGSIFPLEINVAPVQVGTERGYIGILRDITQRKQAEAALLESKQKSENANRAKSDFLSSMSHELRTPLNAILGFSELIGLEESLDPQLKEQVSYIHEAGNHLLGLVDDVLDLAKIEEGKLTTNPENVSVSELLDECQALIIPLSVKTGVRFNIKQQGHSSTVWADRRRLKQVLINLLSNSMKYNRAGGEVTLIYSDHIDGWLRFMVSDDGPGIDESRLKELFVPFNRLGLEGTNIPGTGIGLVITKKLVEMMGGTIGVKSGPGKGSSFWVDLPLTRS